MRKAAYPRDIWEAYPDHDLLPYPLPGARETGARYLARICEMPAGDTLFLFLIRELCSGEPAMDYAEQLSRLSRALDDLTAVGLAVEALQAAGTRQPAYAAAQ